MLILCALLVLMGWYNALTTQAGKEIVSLGISLMGTLALMAVMLMSIGWSLITLWQGVFNGA